MLQIEKLIFLVFNLRLEWSRNMLASTELIFAIDLIISRGILNKHKE